MPTRSRLQVEGFFDPATWTVSYIVLDTGTQQCAIVDSVLDYDPKSGRTSQASADKLIARVRELGATVQWILETHVHADHLSAAPVLQRELGGQLGIGAQITTVQKVFGSLFNAGPDFARDGRQFDHLFDDGEVFHIGGLQARAMHTPGHTPACMTHLIGDAAFVGDTLFMPDGGSARADFPGGDAGQLYDSIQRVLSLPDATRLFMCHDYGPNGRDIAYETTVAEEKAHNIHLAGKTREEFIALRTGRDATLDMPKLIIPALQVNMRGGDLPPADKDGKRYLKVPLNGL